MKPKIVVVGSSNTDMIVKLSRLPKPGETAINGSFAMSQPKDRVQTRVLPLYMLAQT
jgi:hypothetical protein